MDIRILVTRHRDGNETWEQADAVIDTGNMDDNQGWWDSEVRKAIQYPTVIGHVIAAVTVPDSELDKAFNARAVGSFVSTEPVNRSLSA